MSAHARAGFSKAEWLGLPLGARIRIAASYYLGWGYDIGRPRVAYASPAVPPELVVTTAAETNCSTLTASVLTACYPHLEWERRDYQDLQVWDIGRPGSPVDAVVRVGAGHAVSSFGDVGWHLVQGWRSARSGHAFLVRAWPDGWLDVLEASGKGHGGPRWRRVQIAGLVHAYPHALYVARLVP